MRKNLVVLSGSGISAESGLLTFRDMGGLWEQYNVYEVATPEAWARDPALVLRFYNERRKQLLSVQPNEAHLALAGLEKDFQVQIITQNVDDLHERAGSSRILHLHGEIRKARSQADPSLIYEIEGWELKEGDLCEKGSQLRPHVVWFGEEVTEIPQAARITETADIFLIIGTSLNVYPAAGLLASLPSSATVFIIDPDLQVSKLHPHFHYINKKATEGIKDFIRLLKDHR